MSLRLVAAVAVAALAAGCVDAVGTAAAVADAGDRVVEDAELAARVDEVATEALATLPVAGFSVAVGRGGEVVFAAGYGSADVAGGVPTGAGTLQPIGSISKQFTAAVVVRLAAVGALSLDDPAGQHVPLPVADPGPTVRQLLSHTSGLTDAALGPTLQRTDDGIGLDADDALELAGAPGYWTDPGTGFEYSNGGYLAAYEVVASATDSPYRVELERLLRDADLANTRVCTGTAQDGAAAGYEQQHGTWARVVRLGRTPGLAPASPYNAELLHVVCSTAPDLVRWAHGLRTGAVVGADGYATMATRTELADGTEVPYGLGLQRRRYGDHAAVAHGGILTGYVAMLADFPADDTTVALLANTDLDESQTGLLLQQLLGAVFDEPWDQGWEPDPPASQATEPGGTP